MPRPVRRRRYRINPDERTRQLQRAAAAGDHRAQEALLTEQIRLAGGLLAWMSRGPLDWILSASVNELKAAIPKEDLTKLLEKVATAEGTSNRDEAIGGWFASGGWFPEHKLQNFCPRGHHVGGDGFDYVEISPGYSRVMEADPDVVYLWETSPGDALAVASWLSCRVCDAAWPVINVEYR